MIIMILTLNLKYFCYVFNNIKIRLSLVIYKYFVFKDVWIIFNKAINYAFDVKLI